MTLFLVVLVLMSAAVSLPFLVRAYIHYLNWVFERAFR